MGDIQVDVLKAHMTYLFPAIQNSLVSTLLLILYLHNNDNDKYRRLSNSRKRKRKLPMTRPCPLVVVCLRNGLSFLSVYLSHKYSVLKYFTLSEVLYIVYSINTLPAYLTLRVSAYL